jgi:hypothetical protein
LICPDFTCRKTNSNQKQKNNTAKTKEIEMKCTMRKKKLNLGKRLEQSETEFTGIVDHLLCYSYFKEIKKKFLLRGIFTNTSYAKDNEQHEQAL